LLVRHRLKPARVHALDVGERGGIALDRAIERNQAGLVTVWFRSLEIIYLTQGDGT
jgi:hypothetical protein